MYYEVLVASSRYHGSDTLTYESDTTLVTGQIVQVPLGKIKVLAIVVQVVSKPTFSARPVTNHWGIVVPETSIQLIRWLHYYYPAPLGSITDLFTPPAMVKTIELPTQAPVTISSHELPPLTAEQTKAIHKIEESKHKTILLHGDTGTGKTRIYLEVAKKTIEQGRSIVVLTPEIGLTAALVDSFTKVFGSRVYATHSTMTPAARRKQWVAVCANAGPVVLIGPRSALFYPIHDLGLIVVDEAHDTAYKQDQSPYYQSTRVAAKLRDLHDATLIMGSATPLISDYSIFQAKNRSIVRLTKPAIESAAQTKHSIIDLRDRSSFTKSAYLSNQLLEKITGALARNEQTLLFLNRRGSARIILCQACGWQAHCPRCDTALTFHADTHNMRCHSCDYKGSVPGSCPTCASHDLLFKSIGTKALAQEISRHFPHASIARFDGDTHSSEDLSSRFVDLQSGSIDIIIGTQSIAKGHDLPKLSVVGIIQADMSLSVPDYTAAERTYQLISQVSGRIGRGHRDSTLIVQTHNPESDVLGAALKKDYASFYAQEIKERQLYRFPPFVYLMTVTCSRASGASAEAACLRARDKLLDAVSGIAIDGPAPRFTEKVADKYSWHIIVRSKSRAKLLDAVQHLPAGCIPNLDPTDLL